MEFQVALIHEQLNIAPITGPISASAQQTVIIQHQTPLQSAPVMMAAPAQEMPESYRETAPLNEAELTSLLLASPLYRKMENIKKQLAQAAGDKPDDKRM